MRQVIFSVHFPTSYLPCITAGLTFCPTLALWSPLTTLASSPRRPTLFLIAGKLSSVEANLKLVKLCFETGTALDIIQSTFNGACLSLLCGQKLGEDFDPELSLLFALGFDGLPHRHFDPTHRHRGRRATGIRLA